ncbi:MULTISPECIES: phosphoglycerate kinase [Methanobacterium]|nr:MULTISPECIES: phosphoglycerate kinase [Methanobacterium]AIS32877.1 phosphoglycerate kinase Pgk [Methanobacterium formicicum]MBF4475133.1 phosphoglycerate kinase [Methanobacterium formicicum]MDD4809757.1 phosphoglycerate kinase [Methanobacterium formicicum]MDG3546784.1 phosphoglycerate kinase [Methanobacterium formicicum]MDH2660461.1 phosphoglycerate kinase [Methanobacterium formicicum]
MAPDFNTIDDLEVEGKTVLVRVDINSPVDPLTGLLLDDTRIRLHAETIAELANKGAKTVIIAHQSRPGKKDFTTLEQHAEALSNLLDRPVSYVDDIFGSNAREAIGGLHSGDILLLENVRFYSEEILQREAPQQAETHMVKLLSPLADYFINDAFAAAHRSQPSLVGFAVNLPSAAGRVMERELTALYSAVSNVERPCVYVLGGVKVDDSIMVMENALEAGSADYILTTGLVANIFLWGGGVNIRKHNQNFIKDRDYCAYVKKAQELCKKFKDQILVPTDLAVCKDDKRLEYPVDQLPNLPIFDLGTETTTEYARVIRNARTIFANGPAGVFEKEGFNQGTEDILNAISSSPGFSIIGGGHLAAAANQMGLGGISHISSGGGASISLIAGERLPAVEVLKKAALKHK